MATCLLAAAFVFFFANAADSKLLPLCAVFLLLAHARSVTSFAAVLRAGLVGLCASGVLHSKCECQRGWIYLQPLLPRHGELFDADADAEMEQAALLALPAWGFGSCEQCGVESCRV